MNKRYIIYGTDKVACILGKIFLCIKIKQLFFHYQQGTLTLLSQPTTGFYTLLLAEVVKKTV